MASAIVVTGAAEIQIGTGTAGALEHLGYTRDGVNLRFDGYFLDVKTDDAGGEGGPGADSQYLGATCNISMEMTKWDSAVSNKLINRLNIVGQTAGTVSTAVIGGLMITGGYTHRILITLTSGLTSNPTGAGVINFPIVLLKEAIELNKGTKYSTLRLDGVAWTSSAGLLFNTSTSGEA